MITQFDINSFVLVLYPKSAMGQRAPTKLHTHWKGPMRVISNQGAEYTLHDLVQNKNVLIHVSRLKKFEHDSRLGYVASEDLWLPWSSLRTNTVLHQYLRDHNMAKLIPKV